MPHTEPPTKIYKPHPSDTARVTALAQSDAPVKVYQPPAAGSQPTLRADSLP